MSNEFFVINPANEEKLGPIPRLNAGQIAQVAVQARAAHAAWSRVPLSERMKVVGDFLDEFERRAPDIAREITLQMGKPITQSHNEIKGMLHRGRSILEQAEEALAPRRLGQVDNFERYVERIPHGVVLNMAAWNYPLNIAVNVVLPAVLAGNAVILKHSAKTPLCGDHFADTFAAVGAPSGLVTALQADHATMAEFIESGASDYIAFTGSVEGGRQIRIAAREQFTDVGLELGGKDPAYVLEEQDDLDWTAANLAEAFIYNCGQSCCAVERIYVHEKIYDDFLERLVHHASSWTPGNPLDESTNLGPLVSGGARKWIVGQAEDAVKKGAKIVLEGGPADVNGKGFFFKPQIMVDVNHEMSLMKEENFGPVMGVMKVKDDAEALGLMNDSSFGLTASVWGRDKNRIENLLGQLQAGTVFMNRCDYLDPELPWTGYGDSGLGSTLGHEGFGHLTRPRSVHIRIKAGV